MTIQLRLEEFKNYLKEICGNDNPLAEVTLTPEAFDMLIGEIRHEAIVASETHPPSLWPIIYGVTIKRERKNNCHNIRYL